MQEGLLIILSGPSGAGKGTVLKEAFSKDPNLRYSISVTTREPRAGERDGENYHFKTVKQFKQMLLRGEFLEHEKVYGNLYGTPKKEVDGMLEKGYDVILEIDVKGAFAVKEKRPDAIMIFLTPSDKQMIADRLKQRSTESPEQLDMRIRASIEELHYIDRYEYVVINDDAAACSEDLLAIIHTEKLRVKRNHSFIKKLNGGN